MTKRDVKKLAHLVATKALSRAAVIDPLLEGLRLPHASPEDRRRIRMAVEMLASYHERLSGTAVQR